MSQSEAIEVRLADKRVFSAQLVGADAATDLAVLKISADNLPVADWGDSETLEVGEMVWAIGNPYGLDRTLTYGIVSGMGRRGVVGNPYEEFLQTDASINPGNSGGPLVDVHGRVMGITTAIVGKSFRGIGFAIPSTTARRICEEIRQHGHVERGHVGRRGVVGNPYEEFLQTDASINPGNSGGPLVDVHGRVMGITTAIVGKSFRGIGFAIPSTTARRICEEIRQHGHVERGHVGLRLHERPAGGVFITAVAKQSPAALAGLQPGDVITHIDGEYIDSPATLVLMLTRLPIGNKVTATVLREDEVMHVPVRIGRRPKE